jgi:hypothetical protein
MLSPLDAKDSKVRALSSLAAANRLRNPTRSGIRAREASKNASERRYQ